MSSNTFATVVQNSLTNATDLNLTVCVLPFSQLNLPNVPFWQGLYPTLYANATLASALKSTGYIFAASTKEDAIKPLGTSFLLAPTLGIATHHQFANVVQAREVVYFTQLGWGLTLGTMKGVTSNPNAGVRVPEFWLSDVRNFSPTPIYDPTLNQLVKLSAEPDICMFSLDAPVQDSTFMIPYLPRSSFVKAEVAVAGYPGEIDADYAARWAVGKTAEELNAHVSFGTGRYLSVSPGHLMQGLTIDNTIIRDDQNALIYNCYTHPGNSGSPVIPLVKPSQFIAVHFGGAVYPCLNAGVPVSNRVFFSMYVTRVLPIFAAKMSVLTEVKKQQLADYLDGSLRVHNLAADIEDAAKAFLRTKLGDVRPSSDVITPDFNAATFTELPRKNLTPEAEAALIAKFRIASNPTLE